MAEPDAPTSPPTQKVGGRSSGQGAGQSTSARRPATPMAALAAGGMDGGMLFAACRDDQLYTRSLGDKGGAWTAVGSAVGVVAMATLGDTSLYALDGASRIWLMDLAEEGAQWNLWADVPKGTVKGGIEMREQRIALTTSPDGYIWVGTLTEKLMRAPAADPSKGWETVREAVGLCALAVASVVGTEVFALCDDLHMWAWDCAGDQVPWASCGETPVRASSGVAQLGGKFYLPGPNGIHIGEIKGANKVAAGSVLIEWSDALLDAPSKHVETHGVRRYNPSEESSRPQWKLPGKHPGKSAAAVQKLPAAGKSAKVKSAKSSKSVKSSKPAVRRPVAPVANSTVARPTSGSRPRAGVESEVSGAVDFIVEQIKAAHKAGSSSHGSLAVLGSARESTTRSAQQAASEGNCTCKKSRCLKKYCACFAKQEYCTAWCACKDCKNNELNEAVVLKTRAALKFSPKLAEGQDGRTAVIGGCTCKNSECRKNYCECFRAKVACTGACRCVNCANHYGRHPHPTWFHPNFPGVPVEHLPPQKMDLVAAGQQTQRLPAEAYEQGNAPPSTDYTMAVQQQQQTVLSQLQNMVPQQNIGQQQHSQHQLQHQVQLQQLQLQQQQQQLARQQTAQMQIRKQIAQNNIPHYQHQQMHQQQSLNDQQQLQQPNVPALSEEDIRNLVDVTISDNGPLSMKFGEDMTIIECDPSGIGYGAGVRLGMRLRAFQSEQIDNVAFSRLMKRIKATPRPWRLQLQKAHPDALCAEQIKNLLDVSIVSDGPLSMKFGEDMTIIQCSPDGVGYAAGVRMGMRLRLFQNKQLAGLDFKDIMTQIKAEPRPWRLQLSPQSQQQCDNTITEISIADEGNLSMKFDDDMVVIVCDEGGLGHSAGVRVGMRLLGFQGDGLAGLDFSAIMTKIKSTARPWNMQFQQICQEITISAPGALSMKFDDDMTIIQCSPDGIGYAAGVRVGMMLRMFQGEKLEGGTSERFRENMARIKNSPRPWKMLFDRFNPKPQTYCAKLKPDIQSAPCGNSAHTLPSQGQGQTGYSTMSLATLPTEAPLRQPELASAAPEQIVPETRVALWHKTEKRKIVGAAAPLERNLNDYLAKHPEYEVWSERASTSLQPHQSLAQQRMVRATHWVRAPLPSNHSIGQPYLLSLGHTVNPAVVAFPHGGLPGQYWRFELDQLTSTCVSCVNETDCMADAAVQLQQGATVESVAAVSLAAAAQSRAKEALQKAIDGIHHHHQQEPIQRSTPTQQELLQTQQQLRQAQQQTQQSRAALQQKHPPPARANDTAVHAPLSPQSEQKQTNLQSAQQHQLELQQYMLYLEQQAVYQEEIAKQSRPTHWVRAPLPPQTNPGQAFLLRVGNGTVTVPFPSDGLVGQIWRFELDQQSGVCVSQLVDPEEGAEKEYAYRQKQRNRQTEELKALEYSQKIDMQRLRRKHQVQQEHVQQQHKQSKPKGRRSGYMYFTMAKREDVIRENPELQSQVTEQSKIFSNMWKEEGEAGRAPYMEMASVDAQREKDEMGPYSIRVTKEQLVLHKQQTLELNTLKAQHEAAMQVLLSTHQKQLAEEPRLEDDDDDDDWSVEKQLNCFDGETVDAALDRSHLSRCYLGDALAAFAHIRALEVFYGVSSFFLEDFLCALASSGESKLLTEIHCALLRVLSMRKVNAALEDDSGASDPYLLRWLNLNPHTWPELLREWTEDFILTIQSQDELLSARASSVGQHLTTEYCGLSPQAKIEILHFLIDVLCTKSFVVSELTRRSLELEVRYNKDDGKYAECGVCGDGGELLCCDMCACSYHVQCIRPLMNKVPDEDEKWYCQFCLAEDACAVNLQPLGTHDGLRYWYIGGHVFGESLQNGSFQPIALLDVDELLQRAEHEPEQMALYYTQHKLEPKLHLHYRPDVDADFLGELQNWRVRLRKPEIPHALCEAICDVDARRVKSGMPDARQTMKNVSSRYLRPTSDKGSGGITVHWDPATGGWWWYHTASQTSYWDDPQPPTPPEDDGHRRVHGLTYRPAMFSQDYSDNGSLYSRAQEMKIPEKGCGRHIYMYPSEQWTQWELVHLLLLIRRDGTGDWGVKASQLGGRRSASEIREMWNSMEEPVAFEEEAVDAEEEFTVIRRNTWPARARGEGTRDERGLACSSMEHLKELMLAIESAIPPAFMRPVWVQSWRAKWVAEVHAARDGQTVASLLARFETNTKPDLLIPAWRRCTEATKKTLKTATGIVEYSIKRKKSRRSSKKRTIERQIEPEEDEEDDGEEHVAPTINPRAKTLDESNILTGPRNRRQARLNTEIGEGEPEAAANAAASSTKRAVRVQPHSRRKQLHPESWKTGKPFRGWRWASREHTPHVRAPFEKVARRRICRLGRQAGARKLTGFIYNLRELDLALTQKQEELPPVITLQGLWRMDVARARTVAAVEVQLACLGSALSWKSLADVDLCDAATKRPTRRRGRGSKTITLPAHEDAPSWVELAVRGALEAVIAAVELAKYSAEGSTLGANWVPDSKERTARQKAEGLLAVYDRARKKRFEAQGKRKSSEQQQQQQQQQEQEEVGNADDDVADEFVEEEQQRGHARKKAAKRKQPRKKAGKFPSKKKHKPAVAKSATEDRAQVAVGLATGQANVSLAQAFPESMIRSPDGRELQSQDEALASTASIPGNSGNADGIVATPTSPAGSAASKRKIGTLASSTGTGAGGSKRARPSSGTASPAKQPKQARQKEDIGVPEHLIERRVSGRSRKSATSFDPAAEANKPQWG